MASRTTPSAILAGNIAAARVRRRLQQADLAERMRALGWKWVRQTVGEIENNRRRLTSEEVFWLAYALETSVRRLVSPTDDDHWIAAPSGHLVHAQHAMARITSTADGAIRWEGNTPVFMVERARFGPADDGGPEDYFSRPNIPIKESELQPVVAAIVTSELGVLVGRRNDGSPPWTFLAGEQEPGERNEDTAIREVKEESGLRVEAGAVIGERVHPKTGRTMIYMAATPTHGTDVFVGDEDELAEVRWVSLAQLDDLMGAGNVFAPVHEHLARELGE